MNSFALLDDNEEDKSSDLNNLMERYSEVNNSYESLIEMEEGEDNTNEERRRPQKRNRGTNQEEIWTTVGRRGKRFARAAGPDESIIVPEDKIEICMTCTEKLPKQFRLAKALKSENIQDVVHVKYINPYKVVINFSNEESADLLINSKLFNDNGFKCQKTFEISQSYGVIKDVDLDLTDEEILESLSCDTLIMGVKRLKRRNNFDGQWQLSESIRICFKGSSLPSHVNVFDTRANIEPYVYPVTQCSHCWRFGHTLRMCPSNRVVCPKCSNNHGNCETTAFKCNNCGGKHMALSKTCPVFIKEKRIRELMAEFNCSYKRALTLYVPPTPPAPPRVAEDFPVISSRQGTELREQSYPTPVTSAMNQNDTFANVVKESQSKKGNKRKSKRKGSDNLEDNNANFDTGSEESEYENRSRTQDEPGSGKKAKHKGIISWKILINKLKEKILDSNLSWEDKIKRCIEIICKSAISFAVQYFSDLPCFAFLNQFGLG